MEKKSGKHRTEDKKNPSNTGQIKVSRIVYGTRTLAECLKAAIWIYMYNL